MKPLYLRVCALLLGAALPAQSAFVLGPQTCRYPHKGSSIYFGANTYLSADVLRARAAREKFGLDEAAALQALQARYPGLGVQSLHTRVLNCTVYFEARDDAQQAYLFDAETLGQIPTEHRP